MAKRRTNDARDLETLPRVLERVRDAALVVVDLGHGRRSRRRRRRRRALVARGSRIGGALLGGGDLVGLREDRVEAVRALDGQEEALAVEDVRLAALDRELAVDVAARLEHRRQQLRGRRVVAVGREALRRREDLVRLLQPLRARGRRVLGARGGRDRHVVRVGRRGLRRHRAQHRLALLHRRRPVLVLTTHPKCTSEKNRKRKKERKKKSQSLTKKEQRTHQVGVVSDGRTACDCGRKKEGER